MLVATNTTATKIGWRRLGNRGLMSLPAKQGEFVRYWQRVDTLGLASFHPIGPDASKQLSMCSRCRIGSIRNAGAAAAVTPL